MIKVNIYTSYYRKMAQREKKENDIYVQISRTVFCPMKDKTGVAMKNQIDRDFGKFFGNYSSTLRSYYRKLRKIKEKTIDPIIKEFIEKTEANTQKMIDNGFDHINVFLLCHENLEAKYTKTSKAVVDGFVKAGDWQICHRRVLANFVKDTYDYFIPEYDIKDENKEIVYRQYFKHNKISIFSFFKNKKN